MSCGTFTACMSFRGRLAFVRHLIRYPIPQRRFPWPPRSASSSSSAAFASRLFAQDRQGAGQAGAGVAEARRADAARAVVLQSGSGSHPAGRLARLPRQAAEVADGVLFVTPEYNRSMPGVLKNAIDVGSRPYGQSAFDGKPSGVISNSPGALGGFGANHHLQQSCRAFLNVRSCEQPETYLERRRRCLRRQGRTGEGAAAEVHAANISSAFAAWRGAAERSRRRGEADAPYR